MTQDHVVVQDLLDEARKRGVDLSCLDEDARLWIRTLLYG